MGKDFERFQASLRNKMRPIAFSPGAGKGSAKVVLEQHYDRRHISTLPGLSVQETHEFLELDDTIPFGGMYVWPTSGLPAMECEERWRELWLKQIDG